jgi:hypothetical protein
VTKEVGKKTTCRSIAKNNNKAVAFFNQKLRFIRTWFLLFHSLYLYEETQTLLKEANRNVAHSFFRNQETKKKETPCGSVQAKVTAPGTEKPLQQRVCTDAIAQLKRQAMQ